jgi:hypothetical protein
MPRIAVVILICCRHKPTDSSLRLAEEVRHSAELPLLVTPGNKSRNVTSFRIPSRWEPELSVFGACYENTPIRYGERELASVVITGMLTSKLASIMYSYVKENMGE